VWEIGVGYGTYTAWLCDAGKSVLATDIDRECLRIAAERFAGNARVRTAYVDLTEASTICAQADFQADSILCFNVLEHIGDDVAALTWLREAVAPGPVLALIVPAHPGLFGRMDAEAGHFRRYTRTSLRRALSGAGWSCDELRYINLAGAAGWWFHNRVRRSAGLEDVSVNQQMRSADRWLPRLARWTDPCFGRLAGLSVLAIARPESRTADAAGVSSSLSDPR
jgi:2-polyprenyl-3-methyl-5-hydroxy-6-metoxy-1,4-benzoquinol methylase